MLDGGAMFGSVPRPMWSRKIAPDELNRIPMAMRCMLVEAAGQRILIDNGMGTKEDERFLEIHGVSDDAGRKLEDSLANAGVAPADIDVVVCTHLHFDHAGGNTELQDGALRPAFPNARYIVRRDEWELAHLDSEKIRAAYMLQHFDPLEEAGVLELVDDELELVPGVRLLHTPGHTPGHQSVLVEVGKETICFLADLVPTRAHVRPLWIMSYDLEPLVTFETKKRVLERAGVEGWTLVFEHDPWIAAARAAPNPTGMGCTIAEDIRDESTEAFNEEGIAG